MKKKTTEISVNTSSGAEKVERTLKEQTAPVKKPTVKKKTTSAKGEAALGGEEIKKVNASTTDGKAEAESRAAKKRVEVALARKKSQEEKKAAKAKRAAEKKALAEKRAAEKKAKAEKHAAERKAAIEKRKAEKEAKIRERARAKANRNNAHYTKKKERSKKKSVHEERNKGYGGWIAAVVSLGVVSLALATTVTVGAVEMSKSQEAMLGGYRGTVYELNSIMENVDSDLDRVRVSNSRAQQDRILTDLLVQARLAELDIEKLPVSAEKDKNLTAFVNRTAKTCEELLAKLRNGEGLSKSDKERLEALYQTNRTAKAELCKLSECMTDKSLLELLRKGKGKMQDALDAIDKSTIVENGEAIKDKIQESMGAGMRSTVPKTLEEMPRIEAAKAEELCLRYFEGYGVDDFECIGETVTKGYEAYNLQGYDERGNHLFAEISQADGALLRFDYYEDCAGETFDIGGAEKIAEEFLEKLGYEDMEVVRLRANGSNSDFTFVYEEDDIVYYPDEIRVKVCRTRGIVAGFDATRYLKNHRGRVEMNPKITLAEAYDRLFDGLEVESSRVAVVDTAKGETLVYEMLCAYGEEKYFIYLDAENGEELSIVNTNTIA